MIEFYEFIVKMQLKFIKIYVREVCMNADEVVRSIETVFPGETTESLTHRAGIKNKKPRYITLYILSITYAVKVLASHSVSTWPL